MVGFAGCLVVGIAAGNAEHTILYRALVALFVCYVIGWVIGLIGQRVIEENIAAYKRANPIPKDPNKAVITAPDEGALKQSPTSTSKQAA